MRDHFADCDRQWTAPRHCALNLRRRSATKDNDQDGSGVADDRLRLIFTCCQPALPIDARVALTLRTLGWTQRQRENVFGNGIQPVGPRVERESLPSEKWSWSARATCLQSTRLQRVAW